MDSESGRCFGSWFVIFSTMTRWNKTVFFHKNYYYFPYGNKRLDIFCCKYINLKINKSIYFSFFNSANPKFAQQSDKHWMCECQKLLRQSLSKQNNIFSLLICVLNEWSIGHLMPSLEFSKRIASDDGSRNGRTIR